jgi:hypothetical protein
MPLCPGVRASFWAVAIGAMLGWLSVAEAAPRPLPAQMEQIQQELSAAEAATVKKGTADFEKYLDTEPAKAAEMLRDHWVALLVQNRHFAEIDQLCLKTILAQPQETSVIEAMQLARIRANLSAQQPQRALQQAKGLYNVSSLATTDQAMLMVAQCLAAAFPNDPAIVERFKAQQIAGAQAPSGNARVATLPATTRAAATQSATETGENSVLGAIQVDDADYRGVIANNLAEDFGGLMGRGNLLLLADRADQARSLFERAYAQASDAQLQVASEAIARQIKAHDGVIRRANEWVDSIRPKAGKKK